MTGLTNEYFKCSAFEFQLKLNANEHETVQLSFGVRLVIEGDSDI